MNHKDKVSQVGGAAGNDGIDQAMTDFRAALDRMDRSPAEAARIRALADATDHQVAAERESGASQNSATSASESDSRGVAFDCPNGHHFRLPFPAGLTSPLTWECRVCGATASVSARRSPSPEAAKPPRSHWDMLVERDQIRPIAIRAGQVSSAVQSSALRRALGVPISSESLDRALMHRSFAHEHGGLPSNERLEFLGDSVLGLVITDTLYRGHPQLPEGQLAKLRAAVVQMGALAEVARGLQLGAYIRLGRGEEATGGKDKPSILADTLEALIGAVYVDCGLDGASELVHRLFDPVIERSARLGAGLDWKTSLQELTAVELLGVPKYHVEETGPDHRKTFRAVVEVAGQVLGSGEGSSKKAAEQQAAEAAWLFISEEPVRGRPPASGYQQKNPEV
jgi:ribonuclease-3